MIRSFFMIFNFIGGLFLFKIFLITYFLFLLFAISFGEKPSNFNDLPVASQAFEIGLDKGRDSLRGFFGKIVPMQKEYFNNLSENQIKRLPDPKKALIQVDKRQMYRFKRMGKSYRKAVSDFRNLVELLIKHFSESK